MVYHFYQKEGKLERLKSYEPTCMMKKIMLYKKFKTSTKPWISIEKSAWSH